MNPQIPEWLAALGVPGLALWALIISLRSRTPDNPPKDEHGEQIERRLSSVEKDVAILMDRSHR
jgi:hypothetical protein